MRVRALAVAALVAATVASAVGFAVPAPAQAKSFRLAAVEVEAEVRPDASMRVVEHITYDFDGEFRNGHRTIPRGDYRIVEVGVRDRNRNRPLPFEGDAYDLTWHFDARDEQRTFDISYTVLGAVKVGSDVGELYWKFVGPDHPGIGRVAVVVDLPGEGVDVRAWAHGPLHGLVEPQGSMVRASVDRVPAGQFVELRVTQPAGDFRGAPVVTGERLPSVLAEEQRLADDANARRARAAEAERRRELVAGALGVLSPVLAVAGIVVFLVLWVRFGREHRVRQDVGDYLRELPDDPPAFVAMLRSWGAVSPSLLSATLVDLAQRGYLRIEEVREDRRLLPDKVDWRFTATGAPAGDGETLRPFEAAILSRLFAGGPETTHKEFTSWCRSHRTTAQRWWEDVKSLARADFKARHYIEGGKGLVYAANVLCALAVVGVGVGAVAAGSLVGLVGVVAGVVQLALTGLLRRRTPEGRQRLAEWDAVERFLRDFSQLEEAPVASLVLWERYLVYAVAVGVTATVARALAARIPAEAAASGTSPAGFAPWYIGPHGPGALDSIGSLSEFATSVGPAIVASATPPSSSSSGSGGGGGFSGGGGGGGGGGGIGAS
jgi:uncharacterized membrane protein